MCVCFFFAKKKCNFSTLFGFKNPIIQKEKNNKISYLSLSYRASSAVVKELEGKLSLFNCCTPGRLFPLRCERCAINVSSGEWLRRSTRRSLATLSSPRPCAIFAPLLPARKKRIHTASHQILHPHRFSCDSRKNNKTLLCGPSATGQGIQRSLTGRPAHIHYARESPRLPASYLPGMSRSGWSYNHPKQKHDEARVFDTQTRKKKLWKVQWRPHLSHAVV